MNASRADELRAERWLGVRKAWANEIAAEDLPRRRRLQCVSLHLNLVNAELCDTVDAQISQVEVAAQWARKHIEERGQTIDVLRELLRDIWLGYGKVGDISAKLLERIEREVDYALRKS